MNERSSARSAATEGTGGGSAPGVGGVGGGGASRLLSSDGFAGEEENRGGEKPEKSRFNVLLGMLTIATMVDAEGEAAFSGVAKPSAGMEQDERKIGDGTKSGMQETSVFGASAAFETNCC